VGHPGEAGVAPPQADGAGTLAAMGSIGRSNAEVPDSERTTRAPVTRERVEQCYSSAGYWARALPHYADREQMWADACSLGAGIISAVTSLAIWPLLTGVSGTQVTTVSPGAILFSAAALAAAVIALLPRVFSFGEMAGHARELASGYGSMVGDLEDLVLEREFDPVAARPVVERFEATKAKKDALRRLPNRDADEARWARGRASRAEAETAAAEVEVKAVKARRALARERAGEGGTEQATPAGM